MKQSRQLTLIHIWEDYEFHLNIPKSFSGSNKPFVNIYYFDFKANKSMGIGKDINETYSSAVIVYL
jgi:hypothetical protein